VTEVTIGRQNGSPENHVRLAAPTVSRLHARLRFEGGGWQVENLSQTNPLALNGQPLSDAAASPLHDGDQLEVGEYVLVFHER
jgi:pSer/pThr/pTyr-binding forkhead associated (FHA) protein